MVSETTPSDQARGALAQPPALSAGQGLWTHPLQHPHLNRNVITFTNVVTRKRAWKGEIGPRKQEASCQGLWRLQDLFHPNLHQGQPCVL